MAEPKVRFRRQDGSNYPEWEIIPFSQLSVPSGVKNKNNADLESYSISNEKGFVPQSEQFEDAGYLNNADRSLYYIVSPGSFAYNPARINIGSIGYQDVGKDVLVSSLYEIFNTTDELDDSFLMNWFRTEQFQKSVRTLSEGGVRQYFYYDKLCLVKFPLPCMEEQQKIADFLVSVGEVIATSEQEVANLEMQKKAVMKKIFLQEVRFKRKDGTDFPEWEEVRFEDVFDVITDYVAAGSFADIAKNVQYLDKPDYAQLIRTVDVKNRFRNKGFVYVDKRAFDYLYRVELDKEPHIVLPNIGANIGEFYLIEPCNLPYKRNVLGPNAIMLGTSRNIYFWVQYLGSVSFQKNLALIVSSTGQPKFNKTDLRKLEMNSPCEEEQHLIADFLSNFDEAIAAAKKELELWKELKRGLLQQMFV